jgi:hypothetical protein
MEVGTGDQALIGGFIITGNEHKEVVLRGIGPSLGAFGIPNPLADPVLALHAGDQSLITTNDNWKDNSAGDQATLISNGLAPTDDLESAIVISLDPGGYTAIVSGKNDGTGVGLVEAYDLDPGAASELANISTRGLVGTDSNVLIGGFILGSGGENTSVVVRALGPSLAQFGVTGVLSDPTLELHDTNGDLVQSNDNWKDNSAEDQATLISNGLAPTDDLESAIVAPLSPGLYTAIVAGSGNLTGVGLVEVYRLP